MYLEPGLQQGDRWSLLPFLIKALSGSGKTLTFTCVATQPAGPSSVHPLKPRHMGTHLQLGLPSGEQTWKRGSEMGCLGKEFQGSGNLEFVIWKGKGRFGWAHPLGPVGKSATG